MATKLSTYFKAQRLRKGLRYGQLARLAGYRSLVGCANKLIQFEERGSIHWELLQKIATVLEIDETTIEQLIEQDFQEFQERWNKWADEPIRPHLVIRVIPGFFCTSQIPDEVIGGDREGLEQYASDQARTLKKKVFLVLSRRITIHFDEAGANQGEVNATPGEPAGPYMQLQGSNKRFLFTESMGITPLDQPTPPEIGYDPG